MSTATMRSTNAVRGGRAEERGSTAWFWFLVLAGLGLLAFLVAWLGGWIRFTTDPRVREILVMQEEARARFGADGGPATVADATAAMTAMTAIRAKTEALPAHLQRQVERSGGSMMREMFRGRIDAYFAAPPAKRQAELDRQIDREEMMRKAFEAGSAVASALGGRPGGGAAGGQAAGRPAGSASEDDRNRWRKNMIDRTSPEERARYSEYRRAIDDRRRERGLPTSYPR